MNRHSLRTWIAAAVAGIALGAGSASARPFYIVQSGPDAWTVMDPASIERLGDGPVRKAWAVRVQRNILSGNPPTPGYVRTLSEYDCEAQRTRWREFSAFSRSGGLLVSKVNPQPEWGPASEASDTYAAYRVICEGGGGSSVVAADTVAKVVIGLMGSWDPPPTPLAPLTPPPVAASPSTKPPSAKLPAAKPSVAAAKPATPVQKAAPKT